MRWGTVKEEYTRADVLEDYQDRELATIRPFYIPYLVSSNIPLHERSLPVATRVFGIQAGKRVQAQSRSSLPCCTNSARQPSIVIPPLNVHTQMEDWSYLHIPNKILRSISRPKAQVMHQMNICFPPPHHLCLAPNPKKQVTIKKSNKREASNRRRSEAVQTANKAPSRRTKSNTRWQKGSRTMGSKTRDIETTCPNKNEPRKENEPRYHGTPPAATRSPSIAKQTSV